MRLGKQCCPNSKITLRQAQAGFYYHQSRHGWDVSCNFFFRDHMPFSHSPVNSTVFLTGIPMANRMIATSPLAKLLENNCRNSITCLRILAALLDNFISKTSYSWLDSFFVQMRNMMEIMESQYRRNKNREQTGRSLERLAVQKFSFIYEWENPKASVHFLNCGKRLLRDNDFKETGTNKRISLVCKGRLFYFIV